ncbi:MAG: hypothetical protein U9R25_11265 [Chloroflexota bacterium]|nr:hypothetical protein [Chloroflexota bacterium]
MIFHVWSVLCRLAITDQDTNTISLISAVEQLNVQDVPKSEGIIKAPFTLVSLFERADASKPSLGMYRITVKKPSSEPLVSEVFPIDLTDHQRTRLKVEFEGLPAEEEGRFFFLVDLKPEADANWQPVAKIPLTVIFQPQKNEDQAP